MNSYYPNRYFWTFLIVLKIYLYEIKFLSAEKSKKESLASGVNQKYWENHFLSRNIPRFEIAMRFYWKREFDMDYVTCAGVILNNRYVLTLSTCAFKIRQNYKELEYIHYSYGGVYLNDSSVSAVISEKFHFDEFWPYGPITLIRRTNPFKFNHGNQFLSPLRCIKLPEPKELILWENSYDLPNNVEIVSSKWCGKFDQYLEYQFFIKGIRNCKNSIMYKTSKWLIPSCLIDVSFSHGPSLLCEQLEGNPLVLNNVLIGIRNHGGVVPPLPESVSHDLYLNLIPYVPVIKAYMEDYEEC